MKEAILELRKKIGETQKFLADMQDALVTLRKMCPHEWRHQGTGRHGSDKGVDHYRCDVCGSEKEE